MRKIKIPKYKAFLYDIIKKQNYPFIYRLINKKYASLLLKKINISKYYYSYFNKNNFNIFRL